MNQLSPLVLKGLEGSTHTVASAVLAFEKSGSHLPAAREGGEGYAVPVKNSAGRFMLKSYFLPTEQRSQRATFISALELHEILPTLEAAPQSVISGELSPPGQESLSIAGYLAPFIEGETFESVLNESHDLALKERVQLARQLCGTIRVLEANHIAHGDLAMSNVMITNFNGGTPSLRLIDFDGFYHPIVPKIPCSTERGGRGFGQDGYRHWSYQVMDDTITIKSDRAAMAALAFELVAFTSADSDQLRRATLLDQAEIDKGTPRTSDVVIARWPEGWELVKRAFGAPQPEMAPSPAEWHDALTRKYRTLVTPLPPPLAPLPQSSRASLALRIMERGQPERRVNLRNEGNSFAAVSSRLAWLSYLRTERGIELHGSPGGLPVFMNRAGKPTKFNNDIRILLQSGDQIQWDDFVFQVG